MAMSRREMLKRSTAAAVEVAVPSYLAAQTDTLAGKLAKYAAERRNVNGITEFREIPYYDITSIPGFIERNQSRIRTSTAIETSDFYAFVHTEIYTRNKQRNYSDPRNTLTVRFKSKENDVEFTDVGIDSVIDSGTATFQGQSGFAIAGVLNRKEILDKASANAIESLTRFYEGRKQ